MSTSNELILFDKDKLSFKMKFYILMNLLVTNQNSTQGECFILMGIFFIQILSGFFSTQIDVLQVSGSKFDKVLNTIEKVVRLKELFENHYYSFEIFFYIFGVLLVLLTVIFFSICKNVTLSTFYSAKLLFLNYSIKVYIYIGYNILLDFTISNFCFSSSNNPHFKDVTCSFKDKIPIVVISAIMFLYGNFINFFIQNFYTDSLYLSSSPYSKISCGYEALMGVNSIIYAILLQQAKYLKPSIFLIYNCLSSAFFFYFYVKRCIFYNYKTNILGGIFHILYLWTSIFFFIFSFFKFTEISVVYVSSSIIVVYLYFSIKNRLEESILLTTPYYKILNQFYLLYYIKNIINKISSVSNSSEETAILNGILQMHAIECPNKNCISKTKEKIYLPITNEWSDRSKSPINDHVYLLNFVIFVMNYFINHNYYSPEMIVNISLYYLEIIGNYCQSMFYYQKVKEMKLTSQEWFSFMRLKIAISKRLRSKFKPSNEPCMNLEELDVSYYFKYTSLSAQLFEEMNNDINYSLEFWKSFRETQLDNSKIIDFNTIFHLTDKIRITKTQVEKIWSKLFDIFNGVNDLFDLYLAYIEQINDDDLLKRNLEEIKRKNENINDLIQQNLYSLLFSKETGIIIINGDKGKEGIIEKANNEVETIFKYKPDEINGLNISQLMPKLFGREHDRLMRKYFEVGEKKILDKKDRKVFGKDKNSALIYIRIAIKLFPVLNESVYFVGMVVKENIDDVIFLDSGFNIQGMSSKLMNAFKIDNQTLFVDNDIPFYIICKKFVNFFKIFLSSKKKQKKKPKITSSGFEETQFAFTEANQNLVSSGGKSIFDIAKYSDNVAKDFNLVSESRLISEREEDKDCEQEENDNVEINENIELEYEIKIPKYIYDFAQFQNKKEKQNFFQNIQNLDDTISSTHKGQINETIEEDGDEDDNDDNPLKTDKTSLKNKPYNQQFLQSNYQTPNEMQTTPKNGVSMAGNVSVTGAGAAGNTGNASGSKFNNPRPSVAFDPMRSSVNFLSASCTNLNAISSNINVLNAFSRLSEEETVFTKNLQKAKMFFGNEQFNELEDFIDVSNMDSPMSDYKFNFTFDKYRYGNKQTAYIVRCIDNKTDFGKAIVESQGEGGDDPQIQKYRKDRNEALKVKYELLESERNLIVEEYSNFIQYSLENKSFQQLLLQSKEKISKMSIIHGHKKEEIVEDENSSQTSQTGYNADLYKKNHIEEIRANLLKNVSNFYTLKYIKILFLCIFIATALFISLFIYGISSIRVDLEETCNINMSLHLTTFWLSSLVSTAISLRGVTLVSVYSQYDYNAFVKPNTEYFNSLMTISKELYEKTITRFGQLEGSATRFIKDSKTIFWQEENVTYHESEVQDKESYPLGVSQILADVNSFLKNKYLKMNPSNFEKPTDKLYYLYLSYGIIENFYNNVFPSQVEKLKTIPGSLKDYNSKNLNRGVFTIVYYIIASIVIDIAYGVLLFLTNKNMGEGLERVLKIKLEKIEDTIKKIESFNELLQKFRDKEVQLKVVEEQRQKEKEETDDATKTKQQKTQALMSNTAFISENKKHKKLKILSYSYLQFVLLLLIQACFVIPMYLILEQMGIDINKLISIQNHFFGKFLIASTEIIEAKCMISEYETTAEVDFQSLVNRSNLQAIVQDIAIFPKLNTYYNDKYLLDACFAVYNKTEAEYKECLEDQIIKSSNNTDSLLQLINETVDNIYKEENMKKDTEVLYGGTLKKFERYMLLNSSSYSEIEKTFYLFILPVSDIMGDIIKESGETYCSKKMNIILGLSVALAICILGLCIYLGFFFTYKLIHLLSVSRCILKIIPTIVINNTQELEDWIENRY